jgi:hypothetical protein
MKTLLLLLSVSGIAFCAAAQNVGIGTKVPAYSLTVKDSLVTSGGIGIAQVSPNGLVAVGTYADNSNAFIQTHTNNDLAFSTNNGTVKMVLQKITGNFGINVLSPAERLDVGGNVKISGTLQVQGGIPGAGKVLTSNAAGLASWQTPAAPATPAAITSSGFFGAIDAGQLASLPSSTTAVQLPFSENEGSYGFDDGNNMTTAGAYTVPSAGFYHLEWAMRFVPPGLATQDGNIVTYLYKNGAYVLTWFTRIYNGQAIPNTVDGSTNFKLQAGDIITIRQSQNSGQTLTIFNTEESRFSGYRIY